MILIMVSIVTHVCIQGMADKSEQNSGTYILRPVYQVVSWDLSMWENVQHSVCPVAKEKLLSLQHITTKKGSPTSYWTLPVMEKIQVSVADDWASWNLWPPPGDIPVVLDVAFLTQIPGVLKISYQLLTGLP